jgi:polyhydroxybutyrate depolymerase
MNKFLFSILLVNCFQFSYSEEVYKTDSIEIHGIFRKFTFKEPSKNTKDFSLVFVLHGSGGNGNQMLARVPALVNASSSENFIAVFPFGYKNFWNECRKASPAEANQLDVDEQAFFQAMINYFADRYLANRKQVFAIGTSGGGQMAFKLGMTMPDQFKAVSVIIANLPDSSNFDCTALNKPMHIMITNGTLDKTNPYDGGEVILNTGNFGRVVSTEKSVEYWKKLAGYKGDPVMEKLPDTDPTDGKLIEKYSYSGKKKEVVLLKVIGGKHDYPNDIDVHLYSWDFFKQVMKK